MEDMVVFCLVVVASLSVTLNGDFDSGSPCNLTDNDNGADGNIYSYLWTNPNDWFMGVMNASGGMAAADDFVLTSSQTINEVHVLFICDGTPPPANGNEMILYHDDAGFPGALIAHGYDMEVGWTQYDPDKGMDLPEGYNYYVGNYYGLNITLPAGHYWIVTYNPNTPNWLGIQPGCTVHNDESCIYDPFVATWLKSSDYYFSACDMYMVLYNGCTPINRCTWGEMKSQF